MICVMSCTRTAPHLHAIAFFPPIKRFLLTRFLHLPLQTTIRVFYSPNMTCKKPAVDALTSLAKGLCAPCNASCASSASITSSRSLQDGRLSSRPVHHTPLLTRSHVARLCSQRVASRARALSVTLSEHALCPHRRSQCPSCSPFSQCWLYSSPSSTCTAIRTRPATCSSTGTSRRPSPTPGKLAAHGP